MHMDNIARLWRAYTSESLAWQLGQKTDCLPMQEDKTQAENTALRLLAHGQKNASSWLILLGAGAGHSLYALRSAPASIRVLALEADMSAARCVAARMDSDPLPAHFFLLADTSPWALFLLTLAAGMEAQNCTLSWTCPPAERHPTLSTWRKLFLGSLRLSLPPASPTAPRISLGLIAQPTEPNLNNFFAHIPPWIHEVAVVWDSPSPVPPPPCAVPLRVAHRPLQGNFSAQRNAMLELCSGDFCLYLDADERLLPQHWDMLPRLAALHDQGGLQGGALFPRLTLEGDEEHARMGYGLWPDVQHRFFPLCPRPHFVGTVHERLEGLHGRPLLLPGLPIMHYSHIFKDGQSLRQRLGTFDHAAGKSMHTLSAAYPRLPLSLLRLVEKAMGAHAALRLPL